MIAQFVCGSWFVARWAWFVVRGSWFVVRCSWVVVRGLVVVGRGAWSDGSYCGKTECPVAPRSNRFPVAALKGHEPRLSCIQYHQLHDGTVLGVADIHVPVLRHLTRNGLFTQADF